MRLSLIVLTLAIVACGSSSGSSSGSSGTSGNPPPPGTPPPGTPPVNPPVPPNVPPPPPPQPCASQGPLTQKAATLAGCDKGAIVDGARDISRFKNPTNVLIAADGTTYVSDFDSGRIRSVDATGTTKTVLNIPTMQRPFGMAIGPAGFLYVESDTNDMGQNDTTTGTVWKVNIAAGTATVIARNLGRPRGLVMLASGKIAMSDYQHHTISLLDPTSGVATVIAGAKDTPAHTNDVVGTNARFNMPYDIALDAGGNLVVADQGTHRLRLVTAPEGTASVTDIVGSDTPGVADGAVATATLDAPQGIAISGATIYWTELNKKTVRKLDAGQVSTIAGDGTAGFADSDDPKTAKYYGLEGIDVDATRIILADGNVGDDSDHNRIRLIHLP